jgi:hypothetical protein
LLGTWGQGALPQACNTLHSLLISIAQLGHIDVKGLVRLISRPVSGLIPRVEDQVAASRRRLIREMTGQSCIVPASPMGSCSSARDVTNGTRRRLVVALKAKPVYKGFPPVFSSSTTCHTTPLSRSQSVQTFCLYFAVSQYHKLLVAGRPLLHNTKVFTHYNRQHEVLRLRRSRPFVPCFGRAR